MGSGACNLCAAGAAQATSGFAWSGADGATLLLAFIGGMAMLLTPCRLPLLLGVVPLCNDGSTSRSALLALLFGLGVAVTQTMWGVAVALVGTIFGLQEIARYVSLAGGVAAYMFGLWTLSLVRFPLPAIGRDVSFSFVGRSRHASAFGMGLLLGNTGLCCPDPVFLSLVPFMAAKGVLGGGGLLAVAYGLGRAAPLVAIVVVARSGVDALQIVRRHKDGFDRALGWSLVAIGTFAIYGYSNISQGATFCAALMIAPVLAYHLKLRSPMLRMAGWVLATGIGTAAGVRLLFLMLANFS
jgi:cytochrome c-type biogenesis protein